MFDSVVLPAPFSPRSACTSPAAASKVTPSFATTPGNRFVIPAMRTAEEHGEAPGEPAPLSSAEDAGTCPTELARRRDRRDLPDRHPWRATASSRGPGRTLSVFPAGTTTFPFWSTSGPVNTLNLPETMAFRFAAMAAFVFAETFGPIRSEAGEAVLDRAVVEAGLPASVDRRPDALHVVRAPVVRRRRQPLLRRRLASVGVVADPGNALRLRDYAGRGLSTF